MLNQQLTGNHLNQYQVKHAIACVSPIEGVIYRGVVIEAKH